MAIITISREVGSLGTEISQKVKEDLGLQLLNKEVLEKELVGHYGISENKIEKYDEKGPPFWDFSLDRNRYLHFMKTAMYEFARKGSCLIIGRGAQAIFKGFADALHIRVFAPHDLRIERLMNRYKCDETMAEQIIRHSDHDREGFHKFFFNVDWNDQKLYDLMINTNIITIDDAVQMIKGAALATKILEKKPDDEGKLTDICLSQEVYGNIAYIEGIDIGLLEVTATKGIVTIKGVTSVKEIIAKCEKIARSVTGVKKVNNKIIHHTRSLFA
ncbi:MAG: cytidylate kinase [Smithella sp. PtaU1.Bin162]|nr:MAG: cytidylate kinase [Smithella sp. PtaU1.Bin162]